MTDKKIEDEALVKAAQEFVREAMAPYEHLLSADEKAVMRFLLESDLLVDPEGRVDLRRALGDPVLEESGDVATSEAREEDDEGEGTG
jgi:hypothetical protein